MRRACLLLAAASAAAAAVAASPAAPVLIGPQPFVNARDPPFYRSLDPPQAARARLGHAVFNTQWTAAGTPGAARIDGLGPLYNAASCDECHNEGAAARGPLGDGPAPQGLVVQLQLPTAANANAPLQGDPRYGQVLNTVALSPLQPEAQVRIVYQPLRGHYPDGTPWQLRVPRYVLGALRYGPLSAQTLIKPRLAPALFGDGLLQAVPASAILAPGPPAQAGLPAWQWIDGRRELGRFGWQGASLSIRDQTGKALAREMGLTNPAYPQDDCTPAERDCRAQPNGGDPEVAASLFDALVAFQSWLAVPAAPGHEGSVERVRGARLFRQIGCAACHRPQLPVVLPAAHGTLRRARIAAYTDLRLHDLGAALADHDAAGAVVPSRWRTAPLWGLGYRLGRERQLTLLHDGRALSIEQAILWHGGEAASARQRFEQLPRATRRALLQWLGSL